MTRARWPAFVMAIDDIMNFLPVSAELATAGQPTEDQLREIAREGFEIVINLGLIDPSYCLADEAGLVRSLGLEYHHIPVDFKGPTREDLRRFFELLQLSAGRRVFVHCAANYRVSSFVSLYGQAKLGWPAVQADAHARRLWDLDEVWSNFLAESRRDLGIDN